MGYCVKYSEAAVTVFLAFPCQILLPRYVHFLPATLRLLSLSKLTDCDPGSLPDRCDDPLSWSSPHLWGSFLSASSSEESSPSSSRLAHGRLSS